MRKTNKKGFTIVELVIVIAVVAILAAVLVPTFVSVVKKANESKDTQLVRNLNTALAVDTEVGKHETMQSALEAAAKAGYDVAKINTSATDNEILWDSKNDCFVYKKDSSIEYIPNSVSEEQQKAVKNYQYWIIASAPDATYSTYLYDYKGSGTETVTTGLDVGNETVTAITYKNETANAQNVVIRTNGGTLEVNAPKDTVKHYGDLQEANIANVGKTDCYHEFGNVSVVKLVSGKLVTYDSAKINTLDLLNSNVADISVVVDSGVILTIKATNEAQEKITCASKPSQDAFIDNNVEAVLTDTVGNKVVMNGSFENALNSISESGQTVLLMKDVVSENIKTSQDTVIDFNGNKLTINTGSPYGFIADRKLTLRNGEIELKSDRGINSAGFVDIENMYIKGGDNSIVALSVCAGANITNSTLETGGYVVSSFANDNLITISNSKLNATNGSDYSLYHNGSYKGFDLKAVNSIFIGQVYISASIQTSYQNAQFDECTITGLSGIEVKYTNLTLNNCKVTATDTPSYVYNNNGSTTKGAAAVSSDNTMDGTPAPEGIIRINGGEYVGLVGLKEVAGDKYPLLKEVVYIINNATINGKTVNK